jgi:hypothetical protein
MRRSYYLLLVLAILSSCLPSPYKVQNLEYHALPEFRVSTTLFDDSLVTASEGPLRVLWLREPGKPDFAFEMHPRAYGLETVDSTATYVFNVRIEEVMQGSRPAESHEIRSIYKNGKKIYP